MSIIQKVNISGMQNIERFFTEYVFKPVGKHDLEKVEVDENNENIIILYFSEEENPSAKNFVKQMSLKKYATESEFIEKTAKNQNFQTLIKKVKTAKYKLFFFSEKSRRKKDFWELP